MGKPRMIILIRHAQSEGNKNRDIHQTIPDHRVKLTPEGWTQAYDAGRRLRALLRADDTLHFFTSPYRRTRETTEGILKTLTSDEPSPTPFPRHSIKVYEEPRLREQDFGNFQPCSAEMERMWQERADYGHFFYRIPNGESAADAYDRISGFNESLWRQFGEDDCASVCVLVTHGLMSRVFLMKWYHFSVEYFEDLRNVNHCEFLIMRKKEDSGKYILENNLRTWSELKQERLAAAASKEKEREKDAKSPSIPISEKDASKERKLLSSLSASMGTGTSADASGTTSPIPVRKRWGGCPNGCDHGKHHYRKENSMHAMQLNGKPFASSPSTSSLLSFSDPAAQGLPFRRPAARRWQSPSESEDEDDPLGRVGPPSQLQPQNQNNNSKNTHDLHLNVQKSLDEILSSPDGTPSFISVEDRLRSRLGSPSEEMYLGTMTHQGRDFGGTRSGKSSRAGSEGEGEFSVEEDFRKRLAEGQNGLGNAREGRAQSGMGRGALADALGDQSDVGSEGVVDVELEKLEREERSVEGSVY